jgi:hypothetical protein
MLVLFEARLDRGWLSEDDLWRRNRDEHHRELYSCCRDAGTFASTADSAASDTVIYLSMR